MKSSTGKRHPYYLCHTKGCEAYGKSIRCDQLEGDFAILLKSMRLHPSLIKLLIEMVKVAWNQLSVTRQSMSRQIRYIEKQVDDLMDRITDATRHPKARS
ncbi:MAG: hypothetical protein OIF54_05710 [Cohaesibacter sp.]|nr:hypothetical protein [Cohaesibacter sp.]